MSNIFSSAEYICSCGKIHKIKTKIVSGKNAIADVATHIKEVFLSGNIAVCSAKSVENIAEIVQKSLYKNGYTVRSVCIESDMDFEIDKAEQILKIPECVRFLVGVGSGSIADIVRYTAHKYGIGYALIATAPSTDSYLASQVYGLDNGKKIKCENPDMLIIDDDIIENSPAQLVASGYGRVVAQIVNIFDIQYNKYIASYYPCDEVIGELSREIHQFECDKEKSGFKKRLMALLVKISCANEYLNNGYSAVDCFARLLTQSTDGRTEGENSMLAGYIILNLYRCYLNSNATDTLLPPDIIKSIKLLEKSKIINYNKFIKNFELTTVDNYLKQTFVLSEYRKDLYDLINGIDIGELARFWRRLYSDAGFWLRDYMTNYQLMRCLSLSSEMSEGSLIKHIKRLGFLENYI